MNWTQLLGAEKQQAYFQDTLAYVQQRRNQGVEVYPSKEQVFEAFRLTPLEQVKVVILGQDPYHGPNQAHGLCFSVKYPCPPPPSLLNIFAELQASIPGFSIPGHRDLSAWAQQGVLLLNTVLTVERGQAHSHAHLGWERFTDTIIQGISRHRHGVIFLLWGSHARKKATLVDSSRHTVLQAAHPSPLSAHKGFLGCGHFAMTNALLLQQGLAPIRWQLD